MQIWPWCMNDPNAAAEAALARSAPGSTISALLPPSSRWARLSSRAGRLADLAAGRRRAGEGDHPDFGGLDDGGTDVRAAGQQREQSGRQPGLLEDPHQRDAAADRGAGVRLEQHGVAEGQGGGDGADREDQREVERRDHRDDADGAAAGEGPAVLVGGQHVAGRERGQRGGVVAFVGGDVGFQAGLGRDAAGFADDPVLDFRGVLLPELPGAAQHGGAVLRVAGGPFLLRCRGRVAASGRRRTEATP